MNSPGEGEVISGMRKSCNLYVVPDMEKSMNDGVKWFISSNGVILTSGNEEGFLLFVFIINDLFIILEILQESNFERISYSSRWRILSGILTALNIIEIKEVEETE